MVVSTKTLILMSASVYQITVEISIQKTEEVITQIALT